MNDEFHLINEFLNCPHKFKISSHDTLCFEVDILGNIDSHPQYYGDARNNFIETLNLIKKANHMESSHIYSNYIKHLVQCYHAHQDPNYDIEHQNPDENLLDFHKFVSKDPSVLSIIQSIVEKNLMGPI
jgi:hypothetical protein